MLRRTVGRCFNATSDAIGKVHPDVMWGNMQGTYLGPGWVAFVKQMPIEIFTMQGGGTPTNLNDRVGVVQDPEDPRHPVGTIQWGSQSTYDGTFMQLTTGSFGKDEKSSRLMQLLYDNYLEPFSMHRVVGQLYFYDKVPNYLHDAFNASAEYVGQTAAVVGSVMCGMGTTVMEGVTIKGDTNSIYVAEGVQLMENCCLVSDAPSNLVAYQRTENINPYQTWEATDGMCRVMQNTVIEPNCYLDSCSIGPFNRIGHNTKILKNVTSGTMVHVLPGSVVLQNTKMGDGELWGGAPAVKLGKVSKFEWKKPYFASLLHKENALEASKNDSRYGDQIVYYMNEMGKLETLMIELEGHCTPAMKAKIEDFVVGREPFHHTITRIMQGWTPANRPDDKNYGLAPPMPSIKNYAEHNNDSSDSEHHGTYMNLTNIFNDFRW